MLYPEETLQPLPFKDRKGRLIAGGILQIIAGICCAFGLAATVLAIFIFRDLAEETDKHVFNTPILFGICMYAAAMLWFLIVGLGSLSMRRWARALALITAWVGLVTGTATAAGMLISIPMTSQMLSHTKEMPSDMGYIFAIIGMIVVAILYIVFPGILVLLYSGKQVKQTCEYYNPQPSWTDKRPLPVLAASIMLCLQPCSLFFVFAYVQNVWIVGPWFQGFLVLLPTTLAVLLFLVIARGFFRLRTWAWWSAIIVSSLLFGFNIVTYAKMDPMAMLENMGIDKEALGDMNMNMEAMKGNPSAWIPSLIMMLCLLSFLVYTKRYFKNNAQPPISNSNPADNPDTVSSAP